MANYRLRIRKLESRFPDATGLVPHSKEWFEHWYRKIDQVIAGEKNVDLSGMTLAVVDSFIGAGTREARS